jgi:hypothetical protein
MFFESLKTSIGTGARLYLLRGLCITNSSSKERQGETSEIDNELRRTRTIDSRGTKRKALRKVREKSVLLMLQEMEDIERQRRESAEVM